MSRHQPRVSRILRAATTICGVSLIGIGGFTFTGWYSSHPSFLAVIPGWATMKANTALCFCLSGFSIFAMRNQDAAAKGRRIPVSLLVGVSIVALLTLLEYAFQQNFGIDEILIRDWQTVSSHQPPGRMAPATAASFLCMALSLIVIDSTLLSSLCCVAGLSLSLISLIGMLYKPSALYAVPPFSSVSLPTAIGFLIFGLAVLTLQGRSGILPVLFPPMPIRSGPVRSSWAYCFFPRCWASCVCRDRGCAGFRQNSRWV